MDGFTKANTIMWDVFISHASEDKNDVARPLSTRLEKKGIKCWLDENELKVGDSLREKIEQGISFSKYGVVVLSHNFFSKKWTKRELDALFVQEDNEKKIILPVRYNISHEEIVRYSPILADKFSVCLSEGLDVVAEKIYCAVLRDKVQSDERKYDFREYYSGLLFKELKEWDAADNEDSFDRTVLLMQALAEVANVFLAKYKGVILSRPVLFTVVESVIAEIRLIKEKHNIEVVSTIKKAAVITTWILKYRPLQIVDIADDEVSISVILANEIFSLNVMLSYLGIDLNVISVPDKLIKQVLSEFRHKALDSDFMTFRAQILFDKFNK